MLFGQEHVTTYLETDAPRTSREWSASAVDDLIAALEATPDAVVPAYPSWTVRDLAVHVVRICTIAAAALRSGVIARPEVNLPVTRDSSPDVLGTTLRAALQQAQDALGDCSRDRVWGAGAARHPSFWRRRLVRETVLHQWDAEQAATGARAPERAVALELIDEFLTTDVTRALAAPDDGRCGELAIRAGERRWTVELADGTVDAGRHDSPGRTGATIHGDPATVWLWLMRRQPLSAAVELDDIDGVVASFTELVDGFGRLTAEGPCPPRRPTWSEVAPGWPPLADPSGVASGFNGGEQQLGVYHLAVRARVDRPRMTA